MPEKTVKVQMDGYWREKNVGGIPEKSGIYCVYSCTYNHPTLGSSKGSVTVLKLIYIGESDNVQNRIINHEKWLEWGKHVSYGQELCFSFGTVVPSDRPRVEAAMIFKHKPPVNAQYRNEFPFETTTVNLAGATALLETFFTVYGMPAALWYPSFGYGRR